MSSCGTISAAGLAMRSISHQTKDRRQDRAVGSAIVGLAQDEANQFDRTPHTSFSHDTGPMTFDRARA